jgi:biopolymer transport protein ExbB
MEALTFKEIMEQSLVMPLLLVFSVVCLAVALERWMYFLRNARVNTRMLDRVRTFVKAGKFNEAKAEAGRNKGIIPEAIGAQIEAMNLPRNERESLVLYYHQRLQALLSRRLWIFGTLSFICPLIGLLGTVLGVMRSFRDLAISGSGGPSIVAAGISEALIATAGGIAVAITAAIIYNWFNIWMKAALSSADIFGQEMIFLTSNK